MKGLKNYLIYGILAISVGALIYGAISLGNKNQTTPSATDTNYTLELDLSDQGISSVLVEYPANNPEHSQTYTENASLEIKSGTQVKLTANVNTAEFYEFDGWSSNDYTPTTEGTVATFDIGANGTIKPITTEQQTNVVITLAPGIEKISISQDGGQTFTDQTTNITIPIRRGRTITLTKTVNADYNFTNWTVGGENYSTDWTNFNKSTICY